MNDNRTNKQLQEELDRLYNLLSEHASKKVRLMVYEIVDTELELESRCNIWK